MKTSKLNAELSSLESNSKIDPQEIIQPSTPLYKQIFNAHAREQVRIFHFIWPDHELEKTLEFRLLKTQFIIWTKLLVVIQSTVILFWDLLEYLPENRWDSRRMSSFLNGFYSLNRKKRWWKQEKLPDYATEITIKCLLAHSSGQFWIFLHYSFGFNYNHGIFIPVRKRS